MGPLFRNRRPAGQRLLSVSCRWISPAGGPGERHSRSTPMRRDRLAGLKMQRLLSGRGWALYFAGPARVERVSFFARDRSAKTKRNDASYIIVTYRFLSCAQNHVYGETSFVPPRDRARKRNGGSSFRDPRHSIDPLRRAFADCFFAPRIRLPFVRQLKREPRLIRSTQFVAIAQKCPLYISRRL